MHPSIILKKKRLSEEFVLDPFFSKAIENGEDIYRVPSHKS